MILVPLLRMFENRVWRRDEVTGECITLHNEELYDLYSSRNIMWVIKTRRIRWAGYVAYIYWGDERCIQGFVGET
jgi:hypothetical protein